MEATRRRKEQEDRPEGHDSSRISWARQHTATERRSLRAPYKQEVAGSSPAPPIGEKAWK